jgi:hypothetical protein
VLLFFLGRGKFSLMASNVGLMIFLVIGDRVGGVKTNGSCGGMTVGPSLEEMRAENCERLLIRRHVAPQVTSVLEDASFETRLYPRSARSLSGIGRLASWATLAPV